MNRKCRLQVKLGSAFRVLALATVYMAVAAGEKGWGQSELSMLKDPIQTDLGYVSGLTIGEAGKEVHVYRGIPYAAPPVGDLRWRPPQPAAPWQGVRKSTQYGPAAAQYYQPGLRKVDADQSQISEDCLYLNVNTAAKTAQDKLPVMVWLHPGGLDTGTGNTETYNYTALPQHGVVLVTVNHRLGAFGLLAHPDLAAESPHGASGNYGMLDLIAALQWVKRNIGAFGGDPNRVTIFGQSGGDQKVIWLLASPLAKGLFQRAIVETGTSRTLGDNSARIDTEWEAYKPGDKFADKLGAKNIAELRAKSWQEVVNAMPAPPSGAEPVPTRDDRMHQTIDAWSLTDHPINIFDEVLGNDVPILIGGDEDEVGKLFGYNTTEWISALAKEKSNVYVYRFMHVPAKWKKAGMKAPHGFEVRYHFGDLAGMRVDPPGLPADPGLNKDDELVAENTMRMWVNFAATGDPSVEGVIKWPAFKASPGEDRYVTIDVKPEVRSGFLETFKQGIGK
jgi:para-nitrobenzyl esterase